MKLIKAAAALVVLLVLSVVGVTYSWTYTPHGRLDYGAAVFSKLIAWQRQHSSASPSLQERRISQRRFTRKYLASLGFPAPHDVRDIVVRSSGNEIPVRVYTPPGEGPFPVILYFHGGGFVLGDGFATDAPAWALGQFAGAVVLSVDYRLAPENPFPAAVEDCYRVLTYAADNAGELRLDAGRIALMGGSAGGNLAAAVALMARDRGGPALAAQILEVPAVDISGTRHWPTYDEMGDGYFLTTSDIRAMSGAYAASQRHRRNPYASPLLADDHSGLPPAFIVTAEFDPLKGQGLAYVRALEGDGVAVHFEQMSGAIHGFVGSGRKRVALVRREADFLRRIFARESGQ